MKRRVSYSALCFIVIAAFGLRPFDALAQRGPSDARARMICHYHGRVMSTARPLKFGSVAEAEAAVDRILKAAGLTRNFVIEASYGVDNAESGVDGYNRRYIYYNPEFMERIKDAARTDWAALSIMAHEIGHHLQGHRTEDGGRTPQEEREIHHRQELEADKYSGFILRYLGASLSEAQSAVAAYGDKDGSPTHPPMAARLEAIGVGWEEATGIIKSLVAAEEGHARQPTPRRTPARTAPEPPRAETAREAPRARSAAAAVAPISAHNTSTRLSRDSWAWTAFIDAPPETLKRVSCVVYQLHPTFRPATVRVCERGGREAFALKAVGWGAFTIQIQVLMKDGRRYDLSHALTL
jgi:hypothetical protein